MIATFVSFFSSSEGSASEASPGDSSLTSLFQAHSLRHSNDVPVHWAPFTTGTTAMIASIEFAVRAQTMFGGNGKNFTDTQGPEVLCCGFLLGPSRLCLLPEKAVYPGAAGVEPTPYPMTPAPCVRPPPLQPRWTLPAPPWLGEIFPRESKPCRPEQSRLCLPRAADGRPS